jgi:hypothetical protein
VKRPGLRVRLVLTFSPAPDAVSVSVSDDGTRGWRRDPLMCASSAAFVVADSSADLFSLEGLEVFIMCCLFYNIWQFWCEGCRHSNVGAFCDPGQYLCCVAFANYRPNENGVSHLQYEEFVPAANRLCAYYIRWVLTGSSLLVYDFYDILPICSLCKQILQSVREVSEEQSCIYTQRRKRNSVAMSK